VSHPELGLAGAPDDPPDSAEIDPRPAADPELDPELEPPDGLPAAASGEPAERLPAEIVPPLSLPPQPVTRRTIAITDLDAETDMIPTPPTRILPLTGLAVVKSRASGKDGRIYSSRGVKRVQRARR
jgi:hypothetical protein